MPADVRRRTVSVSYLGSREEWLSHRILGGSDAAAIIGRHPHMTNLELWQIKTGRKEPEDLSTNELVLYGTNAEGPLRELFELDFPDLTVEYEPNNLWKNSRFPFATASLDAWLTDQRGRFGVWECKTALLESAAARKKWDGQIPEHYYIQLLWNMGVTEAQFAILCAQHKYIKDGDVMKVTKHYYLERTDQVDAEIGFLMEEGRKFWRYVEEDREPPYKLPDIF